MKYIPTAFLLLLLFCTACKNKEEKVAVVEVIPIDSLFQEYYQFKLRINPLEATKSGVTGYNDVLADYISKPYQEDLEENYDYFLNMAKAYDEAILTPAQALSLKVLAWDAEIKREGLTNKLVTIPSPMFDLPTFELIPLNQIFSFHLEVGLLASGAGAQPFNTVEDYEDWLQRVDDYLEWLDTAILNMQRGIDKDVVLPRVIIQKVLEQLEGFATAEAEDHLFYAPIRNIPENFSEEDRIRFKDAYRNMILDDISPAHEKLKLFLLEEYLPVGTETVGLSKLPHGKQAYKYLIKYHTTTNLSAEEIHELGLEEVARIRSEMELIKDSVGFEGDLNSFFEFVRNSKDQMPFNEPEEVIANFKAIHKRMQPNLSKLFDLKPKSQFEVRRTEAFREASASAEYFTGSKDGSRPGTFYVPIPDVATYNKFMDEALFLHEAIPGHHYQLSLQQENKKLPSFLHGEGMGVFVEGWALYCESLGKELGLYTDPYQYFGMLSMEIHRAIRLVVDTGIHAKGWTREEAIQYSLENEAESEADIISEIERYIVAPGQALSYKIGQLKIRELRTRAETALGDAFSIKEFHNQILSSGSLPLVLLEEKIEKWIEKEKYNR
ncbi:hypothetical protein SB49_07875 [Sediminicola sp. YIK13]|uniref:DUF885 domain-containing protein n=1 Tax=Sediminicola sp. YIK13 TaxID=1453352 RepID=UPI00071F0D9C|nr:DUF885 domain-containing protein [Sediminicola sp. YIK13]ALM07729.1 hypothetical protein SB49_07875 [Sediminicola sp. YIK13]